MHISSIWHQLSELCLYDLVISLTQELKFDSENDAHLLDAVLKSVDVGKYHFVFEVIEFNICIFPLHASSCTKWAWCSSPFYLKSLFSFLSFPSCLVDCATWFREQEYLCHWGPNESANICHRSYQSWQWRNFSTGQWSWERRNSEEVSYYLCNETGFICFFSSTILSSP